MKVKMKSQISGTRNGEPWPGRGEVIDLPDDEAEQLLDQGVAGPADEDGGEVESAAVDTTPGEDGGEVESAAVDTTPGEDGGEVESAAVTSKPAGRRRG